MLDSLNLKILDQTPTARYFQGLNISEQGPVGPVRLFAVINVAYIRSDRRFAINQI